MQNIGNVSNSNNVSIDIKSNEKSLNTNSFNTTNNISINYLEENNQIIEEKFIKSKRTYLEKQYERYYKSVSLCDNPPEGLIRGYGFLQRKITNGLYTIINVIDDHGKYISDHIQLDFKENEFDYSNINKNERRYIQFIGYPDKYVKNKSFDYCINIIEPIEFMKDELKIINPKNHSINSQTVVSLFKSLMSKQCNELYDIMDILQDRLNYITTIYETNFIFDYIINSYMLNTATDDLYRTGIERNRLDNKSIRDLIIIIGSTIYYIEHSRSIRLEEILKHVTYDCNIIQEIPNYTKNTDKFNNFCKTRLYVENDKVIRQLWDVVINRKRNFGDNVNPNNITADTVVVKALNTLNEFM